MAAPEQEERPEVVLWSGGFALLLGRRQRKWPGGADGHLAPLANTGGGSEESLTASPFWA
eukprot:4680616-Pyramimonas_sp.AAC.1